MISNIGQFFSHYYNEIPPNSLRTIGCSAITSFVITILFGGIGKNNPAFDLTNTVLATGISTLATTIHALTHPIFNYIFHTHNGEFNGFKESAKILINSALTHSLINNLTPYKINFINNLLDDEKRKVFLLIPSNVIKMGVDMGLRIVEKIENLVTGSNNAYFGNNQIGNFFGVNFSFNSTPMYITMLSPFSIKV